MRVSRDGTSNSIFFSNFYFFSPAWVTRLGVPANVMNFKLLVRTVHTYTYHSCKNEGACHVYCSHAKLSNLGVI